MLALSPAVMAQGTTECGDPTKVDDNSNGLIEICSLDDLNAVRNQLDGSGLQSTSTEITTGCPNDVCKGYELMRDLDFSDDASYVSTANKMAWTSGSGWPPIGTFAATFDGNGHTISKLMINRSSDNMGLFSRT